MNVSQIVVIAGLMAIAYIGVNCLIAAVIITTSVTSSDGYYEQTLDKVHALALAIILGGVAYVCGATIYAVLSAGI